MNSVQSQFPHSEWAYSDQDRAAYAELRARLERVAKSKRTVTYSDLVAGVQFNIGTVNDGQPYSIDVHDWTPLDRSILGDFLGALAEESYRSGGYLASALAVGAMEKQPTEPFFKWSKELGLLTDNSEQGRLAFWIEHLNKAYADYGA